MKMASSSTEGWHVTLRSTSLRVTAAGLCQSSVVTSINWSIVLSNCLNWAWNLKGSSDYFSLIDVDTLPAWPNPSKEQKAVNFSYPEHFSHINTRGNRFNYVKEFIGGAILFRREHFEAVNGFSNNYYGWGWVIHVHSSLHHGIFPFSIYNLMVFQDLRTLTCAIEYERLDFHCTGLLQKRERFFSSAIKAMASQKTHGAIGTYHGTHSNQHQASEFEKD